MATEYVAMYDFQPNGEGQLALKIGERFRNVTQYTADWWHGESVHTGQVRAQGH